MSRWIWITVVLVLMVAIIIHHRETGPVARGATAQRAALRTLETVLIPDEELTPERLAELRARGPLGLTVLLEKRDALQKFKSTMIPEQEDLQRVNANLARLDEAIDRVGGQRYCSVSRLYWYADLDAAKKAAAASGRPILSLRMLGKLTDQYSCANSRFFRTALYSNQRVSQMLRDKFVLHWQSVRSIPTVTIDFGDGRVLRRTITGNSAHYLLSPAGQPVDVLPGLYGPQAFLDWLVRSDDFMQRYAEAPLDQQPEMLVRYHKECLQTLLADWKRDVENLANGGDADWSAVELSNPAALNQSTDDRLWQALAAGHADAAKLDASSVKLIRRENPTAAQAGTTAITKAVVENPVLRMVRNFESSIALDTVRNEYLLHRRIHEWFAERTAPVDLAQLNGRVYGELFLMPLDDPWLGLAPPDTYSGLDDNGIAHAE